MKGQQLKNLSANSFQLILNQALGLVIFYVLSTGLSKAVFGQINLALAILLAAFNIFSCGMDQLIIKKIAAGEDKHAMLSLYVSHTLITGLFFYGLFLAGLLLFPNHSAIYNLILLVGIGKLMIYFSTPFKQAAIGLELFKLMAYLSVISNLVRSVCLVVAILLHQLNLPVIIAIFIMGDALELLVGIYLFKRIAGVPITIKWNRTSYFSLLTEALPQTGVVLITSALARFDWIFIGFMLSAAKLAEYSFAYKIFEMSSLPLLALAPLLIPRFTKMFKQGNVDVAGLQLLIRVEFIIAAFTILLLNIYWSPIIDWLTAGKYGAVNRYTIFILSLCLPLLYLNNFLWTIYFAQGRLKMILHAFIITLVVNVLGDVVLIPLYKNEGAAIAFLLAGIAQTVFFLQKNKIPQLKMVWQPMVVAVLCAISAGFAAKVLLGDTWLLLPAAIVFYGLLLFITRQVRLNDKQRLKAVFN